MQNEKRGADSTAFPAINMPKRPCSGDQLAADEAECRARIKEDAAGGIHTHIIAPLAGSNAAEAMRTFAEAAG